MPSRVIPTVIYQLAYFHSAFRRAICDVLTNDLDIASRGVQSQGQKLLFKALGPISDPDTPSALLMFDALGECSGKDGEGIGELMTYLLNFIRTYPKLFRIVLTSRPELSIRRVLGSGHAHMDPFVLHEVDVDVVRGDIEMYLRFELNEIAERHSESAWPAYMREEYVVKLAELGGRLFVFAITVVKDLSKLSSPWKRLEVLLTKVSRSAQSSYASG